MKQRLTFTSLVLATTLALAACGSDAAIEATDTGPDETAAPSTTETTTATATTPSTEAPDDAGGEAAITAERFTVDHGCGFGFAKGSEAQDLGLVIAFVGEYTEDGPDVSVPLVLPAENWIVRIETGSDLFSNWCNDAIDESDPIPSVTKTWTIIEGTLTVDAQTDIDDLVSQVTGRLTGVIAESGDEQITFDEIPVTNELWGFFAG